jgi:hypothetical protein
MYWNERDHPIPHFHAECGPHRAAVAIDGSSWLAICLLPASGSFVDERLSMHLSCKPIGFVLAITKPSIQSHPSHNILAMGAVREIRPLVHVAGVAVIGPHELRLLFEDGTVGDVAFDDDEWTGVFEPLRDPTRFARVVVDAGTIAWPDDGLDMAPEPLYAAARRRSAVTVASAE